MGKRYYCDYCDKTFPDSVLNRRKHMKGIQHQSLVKLHYVAFKDPEEILAEESMKKPCQTFGRTGNCSFGANCRFSHLTPERRQELINEIEQRKYRTVTPYKEPSEGRTEPTIDGWLEKRCRDGNKGTEVPDEAALTQAALSLPAVLRGIPNLPPSLLPPSTDSMMRGSTSEWG